MNVLTQILVCVPVIMTATSLITSAISNAFKIENANWKHAITWIVAVLSGVLFKLVGTFNFGLVDCWPGWEYFIAGGFGLIAGAASNGFYDWEKVKNLIELFGQLFAKKEETPEVKQ